MCDVVFVPGVKVTAQTVLFLSTWKILVKLGEDALPTQ